MPQNNNVLIDIHLQVTPEHAEFLDTIDPDNRSRAMRLALNDLMNNTRYKKIQQTLLYMLFIINIGILLMILILIW